MKVKDLVEVMNWDNFRVINNEGQYIRTINMVEYCHNYVPEEILNSTIQRIELQPQEEGINGMLRLEDLITFKNIVVEIHLK